MTDEQINLPPLPEWSKMDDLGQMVPSEIRSALVRYARAAVIADRAARDKDAERYRWLTEDLIYDERAKRDKLFDRMAVMGKGAIDAAIDAAMEKDK